MTLKTRDGASERELKFPRKILTSAKKESQCEIASFISPAGGFTALEYRTNESHFIALLVT